MVVATLKAETAIRRIPEGLFLAIPPSIPAQ